MSERAVKIWLEIKPKNIEGAKAAFKGMVSDLNKRENEMNKVFAQSSSPEYIKQKAGIQFKTNKAQKAMDTAFGKEMTSLGNAAKFGPELGGVVTEFGELAAALGPVGVAIGVAVGAVAALGAAAIKFGGAANPYALERFNLAWDDLYAVIGRAFVPLLNQMEKAMRLAGDAIASILPDASDFEMLWKELEPVLNDVRGIIEELAPSIKVALVMALRAAADAVNVFVKALHVLITAAGPLLRAFALSPVNGKNPALANSYGASMNTGTRFMSFSELGRSNLQSSFDSTRGAGSPADRTADATERTADALERAEQERQGRDATNRAIDGHSSGVGGSF